MPKKRTLKLTIRRPFFNEILAGTKTEEYRDFTPFWKSRLLQKNPDGSFATSKFREYDTVFFRNGYNPDSPTLEVAYRGTRIIEYGSGVRGFGIQLGEVLKTTNVG